MQRSRQNGIMLNKVTYMSWNWQFRSNKDKLKKKINHRLWLQILRYSMHYHSNVMLWSPTGMFSSICVVYFMRKWKLESQYEDCRKFHDSWTKPFLWVTKAHDWGDNSYCRVNFVKKKDSYISDFQRYWCTEMIWQFWKQFRSEVRYAVTGQHADKPNQIKLTIL